MAVIQDLQNSQSEHRMRPFIGYGLLLAGVVVLYLLIRLYGDTLIAPGPNLAADALRPIARVHVNDFLHVLLALAMVIATARTLGGLFRLIHQPPVVGEMIAGILLGPSLLGHIAPGFSAYALPQSIAPLLNVISQVGVILYMFLVGLELDLNNLRNRAHATVTISHASIIAPFLLGASLALLLYPRLSSSSVSFTAFSLFLGVSMSVTAFPVLARILTDRGIHRTKMGTLTLTCAAVDDVSAWCLLAFVVSVTQSRAGSALPVIGMALAYILAMFFVVRPVILQISRVIDSKGRLTQGALAIVLLGILLSSLATEGIGIHAIFGAFVLGAIIPNNSSIARELIAKLEDFVIVFLLPAFFAFTGLRTQIGLLNNKTQWLFCGLIILIASVGKFGGSAIAARLSGLDWRESSALGVLMNTRGLMELIVLNIGLEMGVISPTLFAMLVLMALATTFATTPILHFILPGKELEREADAIEQAREGARAASERTGILVPVSHPSGVASVLNLALSLTTADAPPPRVLALVRPADEGIGAGFREMEEPAPSRSPALAAALDLAWSRGAVVTPEAVWTTDPALDIMQAAQASQVRWLFLESRRPLLAAFGSKYARRGVIGRVLAKAAPLPLNVAVLVQTQRAMAGEITCLVGDARNGLAALELAVQLARANIQSLRVVNVALETSEGQRMRVERSDVQRAASGLELQLSHAATAEEAVKLAPEGIVIAGADIPDRLAVLADNFTRLHNVIVVQGGVIESRELPSRTEEFQTATA